MSTYVRMTDLNPYLVSALGKLGIPIENHQRDPKFEALPASRDSPLWNDFKNPPFDLNVFELGALQNARCGTSSQPQQAVVALNQESITQLAQAVSLAIIPIPPTEPETEAETPVEEVNDQVPIPLPAGIVDLVVRPVYTPKSDHSEKDYYFTKLFAKFESVNGKDRYRPIKSKHHILIKDGGQTIFRCQRHVVSDPRNLYLEFHTCQYNCDLWKERYLNNHNMSYFETPSPPLYK